MVMLCNVQIIIILSMALKTEILAKHNQIFRLASLLCIYSGYNLRINTTGCFKKTDPIECY